MPRKLTYMTYTEENDHLYGMYDLGMGLTEIGYVLLSELYKNWAPPETTQQQSQPERTT